MAQPIQNDIFFTNMHTPIIPNNRKEKRITTLNINRTSLKMKKRKTAPTENSTSYVFNGHLNTSAK